MDKKLKQILIVIATLILDAGLFVIWQRSWINQEIASSLLFILNILSLIIVSRYAELKKTTSDKVWEWTLNVILIGSLIVCMGIVIMR